MIKKLSALILVICLMASLTVNVFAAQVVLSPDRTNASVGDTVLITVSLSGCADANAIGLSVSYDSSALQLETSSCKWLIRGLLSAFDSQSGKGVFASEGDAEDLNGDLFVLAFKVISTEGSGNVSVELIVKDNSTLVADVSSSLSVTSQSDSHVHSYIVQNTATQYLHSNASCTEKAKYYYSCLCGEKSEVTFEWGGYSHVLEHFDRVEPSCEETGISEHYKCSFCSKTFLDSLGTAELASVELSSYGYHSFNDGVCNVCGAEQIHEHSYNSAWSSDEDSHWCECFGCKEIIDLDEHTPDGDGSGGEKVICIVCGYVIREATAPAVTETTDKPESQTQASSSGSTDTAPSDTPDASSEDDSDASESLSSDSNSSAPAVTSSPEADGADGEAETEMSQDVLSVPSDDFSSVLPIIIVLGIISLAAIVLIILMIIKKKKQI